MLLRKTHESLTGLKTINFINPYDFVSLLKSCLYLVMMEGTNVTGVGDLDWVLQDNKGRLKGVKCMHVRGGV